MTKALVVLSGGQDSTTCLFWAIERYGREYVSAVTFDYGQRHRAEIQAAMTIAKIARIERHEVVVIGDILGGTSPLTDPEQPLEQYTDHDSMAEIIGDRVEKTFVPMRNTLFLTIAANRAAISDCDSIVTGVCQEDNANYPDCRERFIWAMERTINQSLGYVGKKHLFIETPLMNMSKAESVKLAVMLPGAYGALAYSHTAYDGQYPPVGHDHATILRAHGFEEADVPDPLILRAWCEGLMNLPTTLNYISKKVEYAIQHIGEDLGTHKPVWLR